MLDVVAGSTCSQCSRLSLCALCSTCTTNSSCRRVRRACRGCRVLAIPIAHGPDVPAVPPGDCLAHRTRHVGEFVVYALRSQARSAHELVLSTSSPCRRARRARGLVVLVLAGWSCVRADLARGVVVSPSSTCSRACRVLAGSSCSSCLLSLACVPCARWSSCASWWVCRRDRRVRDVVVLAS